MNIKQITKYGNSLVIVLDRLTQKLMDLKEGDIVDISDIVKVKEEDLRKWKE